MKIPIAKKRAAVTKFRGGLGELSDTQVETIWSSLDEPTQKAYLEAIKETPKKDR